MYNCITRVHKQLTNALNPKKKYCSTSCKNKLNDEKPRKKEPEETFPTNTISIAESESNIPRSIAQNFFRIL